MLNHFLFKFLFAYFLNYLKNCMKLKIQSFKYFSQLFQFEITVVLIVILIFSEISVSNNIITLYIIFQFFLIFFKICIF